MHTEEYDEDYEEERVIEERATLDEEDRLLHHSPWKNKSPSIDRYGSTSIDTQPHQPNHLRASTENGYFPSIDTNVDATRDANGADNVFIHQRNIPKHQQKATKEFYDTAGGIDKSFKQRTRHPTQPSIDVDVLTSVDRRLEFGRRAFDLLGTRRYWEEKDE
ncbi:hypothetical protein F2Q68_00039329 [Brassica cretica]|uniref:Uncharacterized protein n=1 Tax=Brassica cretica TaxID=69181 RepID=A0A8S9MHL2_BRACR|nr:hypothetical protein F2Q68_00039329 [Brassica cretica]